MEEVNKERIRNDIKAEIKAGAAEGKGGKGVGKASERR